jgi:stearoyl-CoA desaturase (delta-9 desaturase)
MYVSNHTKLVALPQHLLGLFGTIYCILNVWNWSYLLWVYVGWVIIGVFGVSLAYHKIFSHRSFEVKPVLKPLLYTLTYAGMLSGQGSPISYSAVHRCYHHRYADMSPKDPHSPRMYGFWNAYYGWHFKFFYFSLNGVRDLMSNKYLNFSHKHYYKIFIMSYLCIGLISFKFLIFCVVIPGLLHLHEMNILNSFSHSKWFGYRNFDIEDGSVNNLIFGLITWGTGFRNNHHARPEACHNQVRWFEFAPFRYIVAFRRI